MRVHFADLKRPKLLAKRLRDFLDLERAPGLPPVTLARAQACTALMLGYRDWHELHVQTGTRPASPYDEDCDAETVSARRRRQASALRGMGVAPQKTDSLIRALRPSGRLPGRPLPPSEDARMSSSEPGAGKSPAKGIFFVSPRLGPEDTHLWLDDTPRLPLAPGRTATVPPFADTDAIDLSKLLDGDLLILYKPGPRVFSKVFVTDSPVSLKGSGAEVSHRALSGLSGAGNQPRSGQHLPALTPCKP